MTDYLERWGQGADALLEQLERLERAAFAHGGGRGEEEPGQLRPDGPDQGLETAQAGLDGLSHRGQEGGRRAGAEAPEGAPEPGRSDPPALTAQLAALDRAGELERLGRQQLQRDPSPLREGRGAGGALFPGGPGRSSPPALSPMAGWEGPMDSRDQGPAAVHDMDWVEQADRIFRRDGRRYDSGFYLY